MNNPGYCRQAQGLAPEGRAGAPTPVENNPPAPATAPQRVMALLPTAGSALWVGLAAREVRLVTRPDGWLWACGGPERSSRGLREVPMGAVGKRLARAHHADVAWRRSRYADST